MERMTDSDLGWATELLTNAFEGLPPATHMFRGEQSRDKLSYFMRCGCRYALHFGECHTTDEHDAVALWLLPGATQMTPLRMLRAGMFAAPIRFGMSDFKAFGAFVDHTDKIHREATPEPHYYLLTLGAAPGSQGKGSGGSLVRAMLDRADAECRPVYLETQRLENLAIYERLGFTVASETTVPGVGLQNWGMVRAAKPGT